MEEALTRAKATRPLGRTAEPSEIADAVVYLASNRASYITGAVVAMDGAVTPMVVSRVLAQKRTAPNQALEDSAY
jgi:NAD(P)-dependent dehydrogenase (short-subunit alcohol dehydrogenase family)